MLFTLQPWTGNERLYFYRQSQQLAGQTGQIGKLRADFDRDGNGFFSTWEDIRDHLKTEEFKQTFDKTDSELYLVIYAGFAQSESESISKNITWAKRKNFEEGIVSYSYGHLLGYKKGPDGQPEIVPEEAQIVRSVFEMFLTGLSTTDICKKLNEQGAMTKQKKDKWYAALCALIVNYKNKYKSLILDELKTGKLSDDELHGIVIAINSAKDNEVNLPREFFEFAYEYSPCACCREYTVYYMSKHGWLTDEIINECAYDCNNEISQFVGRYYKSRICNLGTGDFYAP